MAMAFLGRTLMSKPTISFSTLFSRSFSSSSHLSRSSPLLRFRLLAFLPDLRLSPAASRLRCFSTRPTTSSLNDPSPKETTLLDGCDFERWLVVMEPPEGNPTRDEIIDSYIKMLAQVLGSEEEAKKSIYSVSNRCYFAFGCLVSEELYKIKRMPRHNYLITVFFFFFVCLDLRMQFVLIFILNAALPRVRWVLPDSYLDVKNKDKGADLPEVWVSQAMGRTLQEAYMSDRHEQWMAQYGVTYKDAAEKELRFNIFKDNVELIESYSEAGDRSHRLGVNRFADLTNEEFIATHTGYGPTQSRALRARATSFTHENVTAT